jgi:GNAT superfamily N-acetyltransferase
MTTLKVIPVTTKQDLDAFITFPWKVYSADPYWVPPMIPDRRDFLDPQKNAFFEHARAQHFLAQRDGKTVGTISAFTNDLYNEFQDVNTGFFGFFEVLDDPPAAAALLRTAEDWARQAGHDTILGPAQFSTNDECGLLIDGFDDSPRILMTYNPPRYADYLVDASYRKAMDLWAYSVDIQDFKRNIPEKLLRITDKVRQRGKYHLRHINMKKYDQEVDLVKRIYNTSWERNWGFVPFTDREFNHLASELKSILDPDLALIVEHQGETIGFAICLPDLNQPLLRAYPRPGKPNILTLLQLIWNWKVVGKLDWLRMFVLGVLPEFRGKGVDALMYIEIAEQAAAKGYKWGELSWVLESNMMMNRTAEMLGGEIYKTYRMYEKDL